MEVRPLTRNGLPSVEQQEVPEWDTLKARAAAFMDVVRGYNKQQRYNLGLWVNVDRSLRGVMVESALPYPMIYYLDETQTIAEADVIKDFRERYLKGADPGEKSRRALFRFVTRGEMAAEVLALDKSVYFDIEDQPDVILAKVGKADVVARLGSFSDKYQTIVNLLFEPFTLQRGEVVVTLLRSMGFVPNELVEHAARLSSQCLGYLIMMLGIPGLRFAEGEIEKQKAVYFVQTMMMLVSMEVVPRPWLDSPMRVLPAALIREQLKWLPGYTLFELL